MLELVVFAQEPRAKRAGEYPPTVIPNATLALDANGVLQRTGARVSSQALSSVADPSFAKVADGALEKKDNVEKDPNGSVLAMGLLCKNEERTRRGLTTMARPVVNDPPCFMTQSPDFIMHLTLPQPAHIGNLCND